MKVVAYLLLAIAVLTMPVALALTNLEVQASNFQTYSRAVAKIGLYDQLPGFVSSIIEAKAKEPSSVVTATGVNAAAIEALLRVVVPPEAMKSTADDLLLDVFDYVEYQRNSASLSLATFRIGLNSPEAIESIREIMAASPPCTVDQLNAMFDNAFFDRGRELFLCRPPAEFHAGQGTIVFATFIPAEIMKITGAIPDQVVVIRGTPEQEAFRAEVRQWRTTVRYILLVPLALLMLSSPLVVRSWMGWLVWWGQALTIGGALGVASSRFGEPWITSRLLGLLDQRLSAFLPAVAGGAPIAVNAAMIEAIGALARELAKTLITGTLRATEDQALILALVGLVMLVLGILLGLIVRRRSRA